MRLLENGKRLHLERLQRVSVKKYIGNLVEYCQLDTMAMVEIPKKLLRAIYIELGRKLFKQGYLK